MNEAKLEYMRSHVRLNSKVSPDNFTLPELVNTFSLLREPEISFEVWLERSGYQATQSPPQQSDAVDPSKLTPEQVAEHNSSIVGMLTTINAATIIPEKK